MGNESERKITKTNRTALAANATNKAMTQNDSKRMGAAVITPMDNEVVTNAINGKEFLEQRLLLCLPNVHQISGMGGIIKTVAAAILAVTYLTEELEEISINVFVRDAVNSQLTELTSEVRSLLDDTKSKVGELIQNVDTTKAIEAKRDEAMWYNPMPVHLSTPCHMPTQDSQPEKVLGRDSVGSTRANLLCLADIVLSPSTILFLFVFLFSKLVIIPWDSMESSHMLVSQVCI
jgi:hypothetical protein